jgi:hypothetical protein
MPTPTATLQRYYPNLKDQVPYHAETEFRQLRTMLYDLIDSKPQILDYTLAAPKRIDAVLVAGKTLYVIIRQDATGGWAVDWATNPDGSLKFKGIATIPPDTTANTYSCFHFIATSPTEAMLIDITGGNLS